MLKKPGKSPRSPRAKVSRGVPSMVAENQSQTETMTPIAINDPPGKLRRKMSLPTGVTYIKIMSDGGGSDTQGPHAHQ